MALNTADHLAATQMFIDERPVDVAIERITKIVDGQGGWTKSPPTTLPPQRVRKVAQGRVSDTKQRMASDGALVIPTAVLIGMPDLDVQRYDKFSLYGVLHEVVWVTRLPEWRTSAEVVERA